MESGILFISLPACIIFSDVKARYPMKKHFKIFRTLLALALFFCLQTVSFSQPPPPQEHGTSGDAPPGGGAPIGEGMYILFGLAGLYGGKKIYDLRKTLQSKDI